MKRNEILIKPKENRLELNKSKSTQKEQSKVIDQRPQPSSIKVKAKYQDKINVKPTYNLLVGRSQSKNSVIDDKDVKNSQLVTKAKKNGNKKEIEEKPLNKNVNIKQVVDKPLSKIINTKRVDDKIVNKSLNTKQIEEKLVNSGRVNKLDNKIKYAAKIQANKSIDPSSIKATERKNSFEPQKLSQIIPKYLKSYSYQITTLKPTKPPQPFQPYYTGLIYFKPYHDRIMLKPISMLDDVYEKYFDMVSNDNDSNYVMNALPELKNCKKDDNMQSKDFGSGRLSRLSNLFEGLSLDTVVVPLKNVPSYYHGPNGKGLVCMRLVLLTKSKVYVDVGFVQYSLDGDKLTLFRLYVSKIYRRMNYLAFMYIETMCGLMTTYPLADKWSIFIFEKNLNVHKFFKYLGFKIEKVSTESKNKTVDYFQYFLLRRKELQSALYTFK